MLEKEKVSVPGFADQNSRHYLRMLLHEDYLHRDLRRVIITVLTMKKVHLLSASLIKSRIDAISAPEYGEVETLEVKESTRFQHTIAKKRITVNCTPIPLLSKTPSNSFDASTGNLRPDRSGQEG